MEKHPTLRLIAEAVSEISERLDAQLGSRDNPVFYRSTPLTLFLPGIVVSGQVVSPRNYKRLIREAIEKSPGFNPETVDQLQDVLLRDSGISPVPANDKSDSFQNNRYQYLYLANCTVLMGLRPFNVPQLQIDIDSVSGWTYGQLSG